MPDVPRYARMLDAYHRARTDELVKIVGTLPLASADRVLDVACGDGTYTAWLCERAGGGRVTGVDSSDPYLDRARAKAPAAEFVRGDVARLPFEDGAFDLTWCAQSLFSLPDPTAVVREMARVTRAGGYVAILENDSLHEILLPWPPGLELAVRQAQLDVLAERFRGHLHEKFYIGRDLVGLLGACGIERVETRTFPVERSAPLGVDDETYLRLYFEDLRTLAFERLDDEAKQQFDDLFSPTSSHYLFTRLDFHATQLEVLALGTAPTRSGGDEL